MSTRNLSPLSAALVDLLLTFLLCMAAFGPMVGVKLAGFDFVTDWQQPLLLSLAVVCGRALVLLGTRTRLGQRWQRSKEVRQRQAKGKSFYDRHQKAMMFGLVIVLATAPFVLESNSYLTKAVILALIYVLLGLGLNVVVGLAGLLDLGYVGFYAVGAYLLALGGQYFDLGFWGALALSPLVAAVLGGLLAFPVLRTHGDYLAIVTLGFGEIIRLLLTNWVDLTGGPNGAQAPAPTFFGLEFSRVAKYGGTPYHEMMGTAFNPNMKFLFLYGVLVTVVVGMVFVLDRLRRMPMGRAWEALREDEIACKSLGLNHVAVKLSAFMMGAMTGGMAGVFFASYQGFVNPTSFTFYESALILAIVVLGGLGSVPGVIVAAFVLTILPEFLRDFSEYRLMMFGTLMVVLMVWKPSGLIAARRPVLATSSDIER